MSNIEQRMEMLMNTFQLLENQCTSLMDSQDVYKDAFAQLDDHRNFLKQKAREKVEEWKSMLD